MRWRALASKSSVCWTDAPELLPCLRVIIRCGRRMAASVTKHAPLHMMMNVSRLC